MEGDIEAKQLVALGTKPVGGIYRIVTGEESTIKAIVLDEIATQEAQEAEDALAEEELGEEEESPGQDERAMAAAAYAKAAIPKPVLAEANFVMRTLSDDDQAYMRKAILIGIERGGPLGRTPNELARLAEGKGHRFTVYQVASAGMKDGSVTLPLGSVDVRPGTRVRFYVRESEFSKREISALWTGYKKRTLEETLLSSSDTNIISRPFEPAACLLVPTLDRGNRFFGGRTAYESRVVNDFLPTLPCIAGFFANGIVGKLDDEQVGQKDAMIHGSASTYVLFGSVSRRPLYLPSKAAAEEAKAAAKLEEDANDNKDLSDGGTSAFARAVLAVQEGKAPRDSNGELILKRREVHSGMSYLRRLFAGSVLALSHFSL
jgi:small ligand-binding sensory domain FIST